MEVIFLMFGDSFLTVGGWSFLCLGVSHSYVGGLVSLTFGGWSVLRLGVGQSYDWGLVFLRLGLVILTFWG